MKMTVYAQQLNNLFYDLDYAILAFCHGLAERLGWLLSPILNLITLTGYKGLFLIALSIAMIVFRKTRRTGICALLALTIGALFTNIIVKNLVARPRPYDFDLDHLRVWWEYVGSHAESDKSFPSGHMTAACAFTSGFVLSRGWKKWLPAGLVYVILMGISRMYLIVHYPSDVLGGFLFGTVAGILSFLIVRAIYRRWGNSSALRETAPEPAAVPAAGENQSAAEGEE